MRSLTPPIFCDHCSCLALAVLDGEILCTACLVDRVLGGGHAASIHPLPLVDVKRGQPVQLVDPTELNSLEAS